MNETPASLSSALGRINKYDVKPDVESGGAIFIRDTFHEQNGSARAHRYRRDYGPDLSRTYKFQNIYIRPLYEKTIIPRAEIAELNRAEFFITTKNVHIHYMYADIRDWFMGIQAVMSTCRGAAGLIGHEWVSGVKYWISAPFILSSSH